MDHWVVHRRFQPFICVRHYYHYYHPCPQRTKAIRSLNSTRLCRYNLQWLWGSGVCILLSLQHHTTAFSPLIYTTSKGFSFPCTISLRQPEVNLGHDGFSEFDTIQLPRRTDRQGRIFVHDFIIPTCIPSIRYYHICTHTSISLPPTPTHTHKQYPKWPLWSNLRSGFWNCAYQN